MDRRSADSGRRCCHGDTSCARIPAAPPPHHHHSSVPYTSRTRVPFSVHRIRQISLHVNRVIPGWLEVLLEYLMCGLIYEPWLGWSIFTRSHSCVPEDAVNLSLCCQPILCYRVCSHPPVCPFHFVSFHRFSSYSSCGKDLQAERVWAWNSGLS